MKTAKVVASLVTLLLTLGWIVALAQAAAACGRAG